FPHPPPPASMQSEVHPLSIARPTIQTLKAQAFRPSSSGGDHIHAGFSFRVVMEVNESPIRRPSRTRHIVRTSKRSQLHSVRAVAIAHPNFKAAGAIRAEHNSTAVRRILRVV